MLDICSRRKPRPPVQKPLRRPGHGSSVTESSLGLLSQNLVNPRQWVYHSYCLSFVSSISWVWSRGLGGLVLISLDHWILSAGHTGRARVICCTGTPSHKPRRRVAGGWFNNYLIYPHLSWYEGNCGGNDRWPYWAAIVLFCAYLCWDCLDLDDSEILRSISALWWFCGSCQACGSDLFSGATVVHGTRVVAVGRSKPRPNVVCPGWPRACEEWNPACTAMGPAC